MRFKKGKKNPYFLMHNSSVNDQRLSLKAKGMLAYLISKPDYWYVNYNDLVSASTNGISSVKATLKELQQSGYLRKIQIRSQNGQFGYIDFMIFEQPQNVISIKNNTAPLIEKPSTVKPSADNLTLINTNKIYITDKKKETTTTVVNYINAAAVLSHDKEEKERIITKLYNLKITNYDKIFQLFSLPDILKYSNWMEQRTQPVKNPIGFFITAINEKWLNDIEESQEHKDDKWYWYKCVICNIVFAYGIPYIGKPTCKKCKEKE